MDFEADVSVDGVPNCEEEDESRRPDGEGEAEVKSELLKSEPLVLADVGEAETSSMIARCDAVRKPSASAREMDADEMEEVVMEVSALVAPQVSKAGGGAGSSAPRFLELTMLHLCKDAA